MDWRVGRAVKATVLKTVGGNPSQVRILYSPHRMIYFERPEGFKPKFDAVSCYLVNNGRILLLQRLPEKPQGGQWGTPAGKIDDNETPEEAVVREVFEETGIQLKEGRAQKINTIFVKFPEYDFNWHMFRSEVSQTDTKIKPDEHSAHLWVSPTEALQMDLVMDEDVCIKYSFKL